MADLFTVTSPLLLRFADTTEMLVVEVYPHEQGIVALPVYWFDEAEPANWFIEGELKGEGPWKVGSTIVRLLSCGDTALSMQWANWQQDLAMQDPTGEYFNTALKRELLIKAGAIL